MSPPEPTRPSTIPGSCQGGLVEDYRRRLPTWPDEPDGPHGPDGPAGKDGWYDADTVDEMLGPDGVRSEAAAVAAALDALGSSGLQAAAAQSRRLVHDDGIRYGSTADGAQARRWVVDPIPVVIDTTGWQELAAGLEQRARLLEALHADLYGERRLVRSGVLPAEVVLAHPGFVPQMDGIALPGAHRLPLLAADLGRDADGSWAVLSDRTAVPSGAGYAMANRRVTSRVMGGLHRSTRLARLRGFFHTVTAALLEAAPTGEDAPRGVVLSPGSASETAYDQSFLATLLGFPLVEAEDLTVRDGRVWLSATDREEQVDVLLRRVDAAWCDPLELRPDSRLGIAGLIEASRHGSVSVANPIGAEVLENAALPAFLPTLSRALLGEDLRLRSAATWWCGDDRGRSHVLTHLDRLVLRPLGRAGGPASVLGWSLTAGERADLRARIETEPWAWAGQDPLPMSTAPVVAGHGLEPRRLVLRTFVVGRGGEHHVMPGGLGRVAPDPGTYLVSTASGALAKDVWVLADPEVTTSRWELGPDPAPRLAGTRLTALAPRVAQNLLWVGRYAERVDATTRLLRVANDLTDDHANRPGTTGAATMTAVHDAVRVVTGLQLVAGPRAQPGSAHDPWTAPVTDATSPGAVAWAVARLVDAADEVRDQLSPDIWHVLSRMETLLVEVPAPGRGLQPLLSDLLESSLAIAGVLAESMVRDASWGFLDAGVRLERAQHTVALVAATVGTARPPMIDGQLSEAVLEIGESILTHRRRSAAGEGPAAPVHSVVGLLLLDRGNPRSVAFQVARLSEAMLMLDDTILAAQVDEIGARLGRVDVHVAGDGDRGELRALLTALTADLARVSQALGGRHLARIAPQRSQGTWWAAGGGA